MFDGDIIIVYSIFLSNILAILVVRTIIKQVAIVDVARYSTRRVRKRKQKNYILSTIPECLVYKSSVKISIVNIRIKVVSFCTAYGIVFSMKIGDYRNAFFR